MGTGTYGQSNPVVINCGFKPKILFIYASETGYNSNVLGVSYYGVPFLGWAEGVVALKSVSYPPSDLIRFTQLDNGLSFYAADFPYNNTRGLTYYYAALG